MDTALALRRWGSFMFSANRSCRRRKTIRTISSETKPVVSQRFNVGAKAPAPEENSPARYKRCPPQEADATGKKLLGPGLLNSQKPQGSPDCALRDR